MQSEFSLKHCLIDTEWSWNEWRRPQKRQELILTICILDSTTNGIYYYFLNLFLYLNIGEKKGRNEGRKCSGKGGRWGEKRKEVVKEQSYKRVFAYLQLFFLNVSLLMDSVVYRVLFIKGSHCKALKKTKKKLIKNNKDQFYPLIVLRIILILF